MSLPVDTLPIPQSSSREARGPLLSIKRYGRTDFERFDAEAARGAQLDIGSARIGKVEIDCKYHWKRSQWGTLGTDQRPAGIVYMDINFKQPHGYCLESASVYVTLAENSSSYALDTKTSRRRDPRTTSLYADYAVQITENYGPRLLNGEKTVQKQTNTTSFTPSIGAAGVELGGMGGQSSTEKEKVDAWCFRGSVGRPRNENGLRTLHWELKENSLARSRLHNEEYSTAFAFEHSQQPVYMRVEIDGILRDRRRKLKHEFLRFSSRLGGKDSSTLTRMEFSDVHRLTKRLDDVANGLDMAMQLENWKKAGVELPGAMPAKFEENQDPRPPSAGIKEEEVATIAPLAAGMAEDMDVVGHRDPVLEALVRQMHLYVEGLNRHDDADVVEDSPREMVEATTEMRDAAASTEGSRTRRQSDSSMPGSEESSITVVNSSPGPFGVESPDDQLKEMVRVPAILFIVRFLVAVANYLSGIENKKRTLMNGGLR